MRNARLQGGVMQGAKILGITLMLSGIVSTAPLAFAAEGNAAPAAHEINRDKVIEEEIQLLRVSSDAKPGFGYFKVGVNDLSQAVEFVYYAQGEERRPYRVEKLKTKEGVVLDHESDRDIITLKSDRFDPAQGGPIDLVYMYNGFFRTTRTFPMELVRNGKNWALRTAGNSNVMYFSNIFFKKKEAFGIIIGVEKVTVTP